LAAITLSTITGAINVGSGASVQLGDVARRLAALCGHENLLTVEPGQSTSDNPRVLVPSLDRLQREVEWHSPASLEARLMEVVEWWRRASPVKVTGR
jgi:nucleoside-diphosphate-sugar epimerase